MECNKDEAARAKEIAERKFVERNYSAAKKFVLKAQNLYPGLDGLSQMMTTLEVYISAENKINGEMDWYGILGVNHMADDETIRKQYRKLALVLHPDKNKSLGAEGAFKLVSEAWSLLSDKTKRLAYNQKRDLKFFRQKVPTHPHSTSAPSSANGFQNFNNVPSNARNVQSKVRVGATSFPSSHSKPETFWTLCNRCKTHYEYLRVYLNHTLLCPNCHEAFLAIEKAPPQNVFKSPSWSSQQQHQNPRQQPVAGNLYGTGKNAKNPETGPSGNSVDNRNFQCGPSSRTGGMGNTVSSASFSAQAASGVQQASEKVRRDRDETQPLTEGERSHLPFPKKTRTTDNTINSYGFHLANETARGDGSAGVGGLPELRKGFPETQKLHGFYGAFNRSNSHRELSLFEIRNMLVEKARIEIRKKLKEWSSLTERSTMNKQTKKQKNDGTNGIKVNGKSSANEKGHQDGKPKAGSLSDDAGSDNEPISINVPDPDFHNFDLDRAESSFGDDQVWACYDDDDGMPRFYARIHKVISLRPFKMRISWLNSRSNNELGPMDWIGSGFTKTCGDFRIGRHEVAGSLNSFSHEVRWVKGLRGVIRIFPQKGEVWALYRNWSADWNKDTPEETIHKYDMVEVLDDFNEEEGVSVAPLIKVVGFRTVFCRHMDPKELRKIPKEEMFRFSHQVPNYFLTGQEAQNAPKGCRELDPAATPLELLQIVTEANQATKTGNEVKSEGVSRIIQQTVDNEVENTSEARKIDMVTQEDGQTKMSGDVAFKDNQGS